MGGTCLIRPTNAPHTSSRPAAEISGTGFSARTRPLTSCVSVDTPSRILATIRLGVSTDTHDVSGRVLAEKPVPEISAAGLEDVCGAFVGRIKQVPPMYSA